MSIKAILRHSLRAAGRRFPQLRRYSGKLGIGRLVAPSSTREQMRLDGDITIELDLSVPIFRYLYFHHDLSSAPELLLSRRLLTRQESVVDVGAHIGYFALVAAKYGGRVTAFEPSRQTFEYMQRNLQLNPTLAGKITCHKIGLSDQAGELPFYRSESQPDTASLHPLDSTDTVVESVQVDTLDHALRGQPVDYLKIDVEGNELAVLCGAEETIKNDQPYILCELVEQNQRNFGHSCRDLVQFFDEHGYTGLHVRHAGSNKAAVTLTALDLAALDSAEAENVLFVPAAKVPEVMARVAR